MESLKDEVLSFLFRLYSDVGTGQGAFKCQQNKFTDSKVHMH